MLEGLSVWAGDHVFCLMVVATWVMACTQPLHRGLPAGDGGNLDIVADSAAPVGGPETTDAASVSGGPEVQAEAFPDTPGCTLTCLASHSEVSVSGYVDLAIGDSSATDVDALQITICHGDDCAVLPREPNDDPLYTAWNCADAGADCVARVFGGKLHPANTIFAYVTLTGDSGSLYAIGGSVMFSFLPVGTSRITIRSSDVTYLDARSSDCVLDLGCCGNAHYQKCSLSWP
jgi:hypothetical protein